MSEEIWVTSDVRGLSGRLILPEMSKWKLVDASLARKTRQEGGPWPEPKSLQARFGAWREGGDGPLCYQHNGEWIRLGVGAAIFVQRPDCKPMPVFLQFDSGHPTRPLHLTPPAGMFDTDHATPLDGALAELGEELIPVLDGYVCYWSWKTSLVCRARVDEYARENGLKTGGQVFPLETWEQAQHGVTLFVGNLNYRVLVECEPDTGSLEVLFPFLVHLPPGVELRDGERSRGGQLLNREVFEGALTTKAQAVFRCLGQF